MYIDNFLFDLSLNSKGEISVLIKIPKHLQDEPIDEVDISITEKDLRHMQHIFEISKMSKSMNDV